MSHKIKYFLSKNKIIRHFLLVFFFNFIFTILPLFPTFAFERNYDIQHIKLKLDFNEQKKSLSGEATISLVPLIEDFSFFQLHAKNMEIREVKFPDHAACSFSADSKKVSIQLPFSFSQKDTITIIISYYTVPEKGIYFNKADKNSPYRSGQIYSHSEPNDARYWFPCYDQPDDKLTSEIIATVPENHFLLSNGRLISERRNRTERTKTYHWRQDKPHSSYLISVAAGEYAEIKDRAGNLPLYYYVYKNQKNLAPNSFAKTAKMVEFFEKIFGYPYPWNKYAQIVVADYKAGGMEHTGATTLNDYTIHDKRAHLDRNSDDLVAHELAHQWFGNLVTCKDWSHLWLNEGFATYSEILFKEYDAGIEAAQYAIYEDQKFYSEMTDAKFHQPIVYRDYRDPEDMFNYIEYQKAGQVLQMLRHIIGDLLFFKSLKTYLSQYEFQSVETKNFTNIVEQIANKDLNYFFDQWLYHGGHPEFKITYQWEPDTKQVLLYVRQVQDDSLGLVPEVFCMPVEIEIIGQHKSISQQIFIDARNDTFAFSFASRPVNIRFDKDNYLLKKMDFIKSQDEWIYQLLNDKNVAARLNALTQLEEDTENSLATILAFERCLLNDPFWAVRREAAYLLIDYNRPQTKEALVKACADSHAKVRVAAINSLSNFYDKKYNPLFRKIAENDSSYKVISAALYALSHVEDEHSFDFFSKFIDMDSHNDIVRSAAFHSLYYLKDERSIPIAIRFASDTTQSNYRRTSALSLLKNVGVGNADVESLLIGLLSDSDRYVKKKAINILGSFKTEQSLSALKQLQETELSADIKRRLRISIEKIERGLGK